MKKVYRSIKLIALLIACLAIPSLAGAYSISKEYVFQRGLADQLSVRAGFF